MIKLLRKWRKSTTSLTWLILATVIFSSLASLPLPWHATVENAFIDLQFKIRGNRNLADSIVYVFIGAEDLKALNGWPITRDYYGYMAHILNERGARVIGFDLLFDTDDRLYPEFDKAFANIMQVSGNVCLPLAFAEMTRDQARYLPEDTRGLRLTPGLNPDLPIAPFREHAAGIGFSNLGQQTVIRQVPIAAVHNDSVYLSFGCELARLYLAGTNTTVKITPAAIHLAKSAKNQVVFPIDREGRLRLNHFGTPENVQSIGFVDLLQAYQAAPDSIDFTGKLVIVAVTAPGVVPVKVTPLSAAVPASLIHATVAENLITGNYLRDLPIPAHWLIIAILLASLFLFWHSRQSKILISGTFITIISYWLLAVVLFSSVNILFPLFYPTLSYFVVLAFLGRDRVHRHRIRNSLEKQELEVQIEAKQQQLELAKASLIELQAHMQQELEEKEALSRESQQLLDDSRQTVLRLEHQLQDLHGYVVPQPDRDLRHFPEIIHAENSKMVQILELITKIGSDDIPVLIVGATGTGKEMVARAIHTSGKRKQAPFIAVNCGALPETLLESELFGHEKGSFTGAQARRRGRFEIANGGTLFLDEITETTPAFQAKLLRVLQEGTFERLGSEKTLQVNVRIIAASSKDLKQEVQKNTFRADLFYRLNGFPIALPTLSERQEDIPLLAVHFLQKHHYQPVTSISRAAMELLLVYPWPGNIRELENEIRRAAILAQGEGRKIIQVQDLSKEITEGHFATDVSGHFQPLEIQILAMLRSLKFSHKSINQTAKALGNRDRGTITEYFRGICFEHLVNNGFDVNQAALAIAGTDDAEIVSRIITKMTGYLNNLTLEPEPGDNNLSPQELPASYKGLPRKYHPYLEQVIQHLHAQN